MFGWYHSKSALGIWLITPDFSYKVRMRSHMPVFVTSLQPRSHPPPCLPCVQNGNWMNQELTAYGPTTGTGSLFAIIQYVAGEHYGSGEQDVPLDSTGWKKSPRAFTHMALSPRAAASLPPATSHLRCSLLLAFVVGPMAPS